LICGVILIVTIIEGKICTGFGWASKCLPAQIDFFKHLLPEITTMHHEGTINVELEHPVKFLKYDAVTPSIIWRQNYPPEIFSFIKADFFTNAAKMEKPVPCLLYFASTSPHQSTPNKLEVITRKLDLNGVENCTVHVKHSCRRVRVEWFIFG